MAATSRARVGRSGHGVYPSVRTTTTSGFGRAASAAAMPTRMSVPPPPTNRTSVARLTRVVAPTSASQARTISAPWSDAGGPDHAPSLREGSLQFRLAHAAGRIDDNCDRQQESLQRGSDDARDAPSARSTVGVIAAASRVRDRAAYSGVSGRTAAPENYPMTEAQCERKIALLRASWSTFNDIAARVSPALRKGPRGGGRVRGQIIRHVNGAEIHEFAPKVGVKVPLETRDGAGALRAYRDAFVEAIREHRARGEPARSWALQFLIRRCAWHMLDHAWELEDGREA